MAPMLSMKSWANAAIMTNPLINPLTIETATTAKAGVKMNTTKISGIKTAITKASTSTTPAAKPVTANRGATILKTTLVAGSIVATLLGADLMARQDQSGATATAPVAAHAASAEVNAPQPRSATVPNLAAVPNLNASEINRLLNTPLAPIPSRSSLAPLTRSRSSR